MDAKGNTVDFLLTAKQDASAAKRFFRKTLQATHTQSPRVINVDKNADEPKAIDKMKAFVELSKTVELRQNKYFNNRLEQDYRFIKRLTKLRIGFYLFNTARRTLSGFEALNILRTRTSRGSGKRRRFGSHSIRISNFWSSSLNVSSLRGALVLMIFFATQPIE